MTNGWVDQPDQPNARAGRTGSSAGDLPTTAIPGIGPGAYLPTTAIPGPGRGGTFSQPTYHHVHPATGQPVGEPNQPAGDSGQSDQPDQPDQSAQSGQTGKDITVTRAVLVRSKYFSKLLAHKVRAASEADGAKESGLTAMIWNQVMSNGADAMALVALAGTVFFAAPTQGAQRGNVLLYLAITIAPFAVVAPLIGPGLDRFQHGRRLIMGLTGLGRATLAIVMAMNFKDLLILLPAALGSMVLSKAYTVVRSAAAPRLVPEGLTLVETNGRLSLFGLAATILGGGFAGLVIKAFNSYPLGLYVGAAAFLLTAFYAFRLPKIVDALPPPSGAKSADGRRGKKNSESAPTGASYPGDYYSSEYTGSIYSSDTTKPTIWHRLRAWAVKGFSRQVVGALQGQSALRWLSGFLFFFMVFYVEHSAHGLSAARDIGMFGAGIGVGNFLGNAIGTRLKIKRPNLIIVTGNITAATGTALAALLFSIPIMMITAFLFAISNTLGKLSLDSVIQRDVSESLRASAFGRSETYLQLSYCIGAVIGILLPSKHPGLAMWVATIVVGLVAFYAPLRMRSSQYGASGPNRNGSPVSRLRIRLCPNFWW